MEVTGHTTHTLTRTRRPEVAVNFCSAFNPSRIVPPPGAVGSFSAPGDQVNRPSRSGTDRIVLFFLHVFLLGLFAEETPCEHRENMQTPGDSPLEIAHLSTVHSGEDLPPRANSAPCWNRTHDLLAVRLPHQKSSTEDVLSAAAEEDPKSTRLNSSA